MARKKRQGKGEIRVRENGEGLDEDIGDCLVAREMWVELVSLTKSG